VPCDAKMSVPERFAKFWKKVQPSRTCCDFVSLDVRMQFLRLQWVFV
jgi:hypothetical protein